MCRETVSSCISTHQIKQTFFKGLFQLVDSANVAVDSINSLFSEACEEKEYIIASVQHPRLNTTRLVKKRNRFSVHKRLGLYGIKTLYDFHALIGENREK